MINHITDATFRTAALVSILLLALPLLLIGCGGDELDEIDPTPTPPRSDQAEYTKHFVQTP